jgi:hypothetical protein
MMRGTGRWQRIDSLPLQRGELFWIGNLVLYWKPDEKQPWYLATNLLCPYTTLKLYRRRMWIEEMFGDLEASHLRHFLRSSRLTLAVYLLYIWLVAMAEYVIDANKQSWVDRNDRRDLSIFRFGLDFLDRCLALNDPIPKVSIPNSCSVSGG